MHWYAQTYRHNTPSSQTENILTLSWSCYFTEGELEAEWLQDVGLSTLISGDEEEDGKALLSTLTRTQAAAVKKRYNTYTQTMRKKNKQSVRDVRDIFGVSDSPVSNEHGSRGLVWWQGGDGRRTWKKYQKIPVTLYVLENIKADSLVPNFTNLKLKRSFLMSHTAIFLNTKCIPFFVEVVK